MKSTWRYVALTAIFLASVALAAFFHYFPVGTVAELASVPAIAALFGALFQLSRDSLAYDRTLRLEEAKNRFTVGATSHMAEVAFDKHVLFCEEYTVGVHAVLTTLFKRGPHEDVLVDADSLVGVRTKWAVWLVPELEEGLGKFESELRKIGANAHLLSALAAHEDRTDAIKEAYGGFAAVMGWEKWRGEPVTQDVAAAKIVDGLRDVLGIKQLTELRTRLVKRAFDSLSGI